MFKQDGPAPVPAEGLAAALAPFGQSRMLPREAYVDPAVFEWEQRNIFSGWTCVGHAGDLATVGAQRAVGSGPNAFLLVQSEEHTSELQSLAYLVCRLLLEKKKKKQ